jgi:hypothetical protein
MAISGDMRSWQNDPQLGGVRDEAELAKLAKAEREQWVKLWADVEELRAKATR